MRISKPQPRDPGRHFPPTIDASSAGESSDTQPRGVRRRGVRFDLGCLPLLVPVGLFVAALVFVVLAAVPRPRDTTEPTVFAADGADLDYCERATLDGSGRTAEEIAKAFTPGCAWETWPMPVLAECTEPLADGVVDMRGLWRGRSGEVDHVERIEQCGNRTVITSAGIIHDFVTDGTLRNGARDVMGGGRCWNIFAAIEWREGVMQFRPFGVPKALVTRAFRGDELVWTYPGIGELAMERICWVPEGHRVGGMR